MARYSESQFKLPEEKQYCSLRGKRRFKAVVRLVIANRWWLNDVGSEDDLGDNVLKNVNILNQKKQKYSSVLKLEEKILFNKPLPDRTDEDKSKILEIIDRLKCFEAYPQIAKERLAGVTTFCFYPKDRIIVKQDHPPLSLYYLLSGEVSILQQVYDPILNTISVIDLGVVGAGTMVGEAALLLKTNRTATIKTNTFCEFLRIDKEYIDIIFETIWMNWERLLETINSVPHLRKLDDVTKHECCVLAKFTNYEPDEVIVGPNTGLLSYIYFVLKGTCYVMEKLLVEVTKNKSNRKSCSIYERGSDMADLEKLRKKKIVRQSSDCSVNRKILAYEAKLRPSGSITIYDKQKIPKNVEVHYVKVCEFAPRSCFNVGETLNKRSIIAKTNVQCLLVPRYWLMQKQKDNSWIYIKNFINSHVPTKEQVFENFLKEKNYENYKQQLIEDILAKKKVVTGNSYHNVPYSLRIGKDMDLL